MKINFKSRYNFLWLTLLLVIADQALKFFIKLNMTLGESFEIFSWFKILFIENPGMAFGITLGSKVFLTLFRIVVSGVVCYYLVKLIKSGYRRSYIFIVTLILAGALGNIIDCLFYGLIFSESTVMSVATLFPASGGYAPFLMGKVVDMFYFPLFVIPNWVPFWGGEIFFSPIFNLADSYITVGIIVLILFFRKDFNITIDGMFKKSEKKV